MLLKAPSSNKKVTWAAATTAVAEANGKKYLFYEGATIWLFLPHSLAFNCNSETCLYYKAIRASAAL